MPQTQFVVALGGRIDQLLQSEALHEPLQLAFRHRALGQIHEVRLDPALGEESLRLSRIRAFLDAEDLHFHVPRFS